MDLCASCYVQVNPTGRPCVRPELAFPIMVMDGNERRPLGVSNRSGSSSEGSTSTSSISLFVSLVYCAESTVRWIVVRKKYCWMAADSANKSKRTERIDDSPSIKLFRFHELLPTSTDLSDLRVELGLIGPSRTCMHRSSSTGLLNHCRCRLLLGWSVQANTCVHSRLH
jgi:hypothetical protein